MYWWAKAADAVGAGQAKRFGLITTNSLRQAFSRKVVDASFKKYPGLSIRFVVPDHPWVDSAAGADVRVTLISIGKDGSQGEIARVVKEESYGDDEVAVELAFESGLVSSNLTIGVDPASAAELRANSGIACVGYQISGKGFVVNLAQALNLVSNDGEAKRLIRPLLTGRDLTQNPRSLFAIDVFGITVEQLRENFPHIYQWLLERVKPERDINNRAALRQRWWIFGEARSTFRPTLAGIHRAICTSLTAKHRIFAAVQASTICDSTTVMFASEEGSFFGVLSSRIHVAWALAAGGRLGVGNDARYNKTRCFETFPFPEITEPQAGKIRQLAEQLDAHRKRRQAEHPDLTLTGMYNVLEKLRSGESLNAKEKTFHQQGLVSVLKELHDELDRAVFDAYGWNDLAEKLVGKPGATTPLPDKPAAQAEAEEELLTRLVALNAQRSAEEAQGHIRWLRPDYQAPGAIQGSADLGSVEVEQTAVAAPQGKQTWPKTMPEQVAAIRGLLSRGPQSSEALAGQFKRKPIAAVEQVLAALQVLGHADHLGTQWHRT